MAAGKEIRSKIKSVQNTQKITRAMEKVAMSKMRKASERMMHARPYDEAIRHTLGQREAAVENPSFDDLRPMGVRARVLESDAVRREITPDASYGTAERDIFYAAIGFAAARDAGDAGQLSVTAAEDLQGGLHLEAQAQGVALADLDDR